MLIDHHPCPDPVSKMLDHEHWLPHEGLFRGVLAAAWMCGSVRHRGGCYAYLYLRAHLSSVVGPSQSRFLPHPLVLVQCMGPRLACTECLVFYLSKKASSPKPASGIAPTPEGVAVLPRRVPLHLVPPEQTRALTLTNCVSYDVRQCNAGLRSNGRNTGNQRQTTAERIG